MSDLQDVIVDSSIKSFNHGHRVGIQTGKQSERQRILRLIAELRIDAELGMVGDYLFCDDLIDYIVEEREPLR